MAKRSISRTIVAGAGIGVLIAVIFPVMVFVFGVGNPNVLPQDTDPDPFEIPVIPQPDIDPIIENPELFCNIPQSELQKIAECEFQTQDEKQVGQQNLPVDECSQVNRESVEICGAEIDQLLFELQEDAQPDIDPIPEEPVETSIDDPFTQICDQTPDLIICGDSRSLELITRVVKTDSQGLQTTVEERTIFTRLQFFVENATNRDFSTGLLQFELQVKGDPEFKYTGTGKIDLLIGTQSIFSQPVNVRVDGTADSEGKIDVLFISPTGSTSDLLLFNFEQNFQKFNDESVTPIRLHVVELNISGERDQNFAIVDEDLFTMDIARDDIQLLITDEQGIKSRVYPSDSRLIVNSKTNTSEPALIGLTRVRTFESTFYGNGLGCSQFQLISDRTFTLTTQVTSTVPAPTLTGITITNEEGSIVNSRASGGSYSFNELTRNQNYTLKLTNPNITSEPLDYGKSQETKTFECRQQGTTNVKGVSVTQGNTGICGYYEIRSSTVLNTDSPVTVTPNSITCNIPE